jgi:cell division protein FtsB
MAWPPEAFWLALVVAIPSTAVMIAGQRKSMVADLRRQIKRLEEQVERLREDNEWLIRQARRLTGETPPRRPESEM